jgi:hypothetical protein
MTCESDKALTVRCPRCQAGLGVSCRPVGLSERLQAWGDPRPPLHWDRWLALGNRELDRQRARA